MFFVWAWSNAYTLLQMLINSILPIIFRRVPLSLFHWLFLLLIYSVDVSKTKLTAQMKRLWLNLTACFSQSFPFFPLFLWPSVNALAISCCQQLLSASRSVWTTFVNHPTASWNSFQLKGVWIEPRVRGQRLCQPAGFVYFYMPVQVCHTWAFQHTFNKNQ